MSVDKTTTVTTRQSILNAATSVMAENGFEGATLNVIAQEAGVTEPTIYLHFEGKESLLFSIAEEQMARYLLFLNEHLQGISGAQNKLSKLVWAHLRYSDTNREFMHVVLFDCRNNRNFYQSGAYNLVRKYAGVLSSILDEGVREKAFRSDLNIPLVRDIIFGLMDYEAIRYFVTRENPDAAKDHKDIMRLLDRMLLCEYRARDKPAGKKQRILQAAVEAFSEKGYTEVTISEIASRADVSKGTIYEYFENKEDVLLSISEEHFKKDLEQLKKAFNGADLRKKLLLFMQYYFQQYLDDRNYITVFLTMIQFNRRFYQSRAYKSQYKYVIGLEGMIQKILDGEGGVQNINIHVFRNMFLGAFTHMALRWFLAHNDRHFDKMEEMKEVAELLSDAVLPGDPRTGSISGEKTEEPSSAGGYPDQGQSGGMDT
ncbi:MAG: TetR/AcrR family transcriptional regulator [Actinomycetota bacterium]